MAAKLTFENSWEHHIYKVDGVVVSKLTEVRIGRKLYKVYGRNMSVDYSDMGHTYSSTSMHYFIDIPFAAAPKGKISVELCDLDLNKIIPTKFTTRHSTD